MNWLQIGLFFSIIFVLYYLQQIKMTLKGKGHEVDMFTGWITDYRKFMQLIKSEEDQRQKAKYQGILNGLQLAAIGLVVIGVMLFSGK